MIKFTESDFAEVYNLVKLKEENGEKYAYAINAIFPNGSDHKYSTDQMINFNDKRYNQEKLKTISRGRPYFEGSSEKEFKDDFHGFIKDFIENGDINEVDKSTINEFLINYIERLALNDVKEVRNDKNVNSAIAHLDRRPLYHYNKQK
jgi:hypothetical protein